MIFTQREDQYWATRTNWVDMAELIKTKWDEGYAITDMVYGDDVYFVLMEKGTGVLGQEYSWNKSLDKILEENSSGSETRCITSICYDGSSACLVRSSFKNGMEQRWCQSAVFPKKDIKFYWNLGYTITVMNWHRGFWWLLFSKGIPYNSKESWETMFRPKPAILSRKLQKESKIITSLCFGDGKWAFAYAHHPEVHSQKILMSKEFPDNEIAELWNENFDISKVAYGKGHWFLTLNSSDVSKGIPEMKEKMGKPGSRLSVDRKSVTEWKQSMAREEQEKRKAEQERKNIKY